MPSYCPICNTTHDDNDARTTRCFVTDPDAAMIDALLRSVEDDIQNDDPEWWRDL